MLLAHSCLRLSLNESLHCLANFAINNQKVYFDYLEEHNRWEYENRFTKISQKVVSYADRRSVKCENAQYMGTAKNTPKLLQLSSSDLFRMSLSNALRLISLYNLQQSQQSNSFRNTKVDTHGYVLYNLFMFM